MTTPTTAADEVPAVEMQAMDLADEARAALDAVQKARARVDLAWQELEQARMALHEATSRLETALDTFWDTTDERHPGVAAYRDELLARHG